MGCHFLPDPGIESGYPALDADTLTSEPPGKPGNGKKKEMAAHFSTLAWKIPWTEEPDRL